MGGNQAEEVRQLVHPSHIHVHAVFLLAAKQVLAVRQPERVHHVRHVRQELLHIGQTGVRPVAEERGAPSGPGQGNTIVIIHLLMHAVSNVELDQGGRGGLNIVIHHKIISP